VKEVHIGLISSNFMFRWYQTGLH